MEAYIRYDSKTRVVTFVHHKPFDSVHGLNMTRDELLKTGVFVSEFPSPEYVPGKRAIAYYNPETKKISYEYEYVPVSQEERFEQLEAAVNISLMAGMGLMDEKEDEEEE